MRERFHAQQFFLWSYIELQLEHDASRSQKFMIALAASPREYHKTGIDFLMMPSIQHCRKKSQLAHREIPNWRHQFILLKLFEYLSFAFFVIPQSSYTHRESVVIVGVCRQSMYDYMRHKTKDFHFLLPFSFPSLSIFRLPFLFLFHILLCHSADWRKAISSSATDCDYLKDIFWSFISLPPLVRESERLIYISFHSSELLFHIRACKIDM